jgi:hypothetical protein
MIEIHYAIGDIKTSMFVHDSHSFYLLENTWITAKNLNAGDKIQACSGAPAEVLAVNKAASIENSLHFGNLKTSHNHNYFISKKSKVDNKKNSSVCNNAPQDSFEFLAFDQADKPSKLANGEPSGNHSGPWAAAKYIDNDSPIEIIALGCANDLMCAEDAALKNLKAELVENAENTENLDLSTIKLHRGNVRISHAYVRKYSRKGRIVNTISPCQHCRDNYGDALNDKSLGKSDLEKSHRGFLALR